MAMSPAPSSGLRVPWAFWVACGLSAIAAVAPLAFGGSSNRVGSVLIPFGVAAILFGAGALLYSRGRPIATLVYFLASLAIVYGMLGLLTLPLRLAVIGTCPPPPTVCAAGFEPPMTSGESTALGLAVGLGIAAILAGFFGLTALYRHRAPASFASAPPPTRRIAPVSSRLPVETESIPVPAEADVVAAVPAASPAELAAEAEPVSAATPELSAHDEPLELSAHVEPLELPAVGTEDPVAAAAAPPRRKPRRKRTPPPDSGSAPGANGAA